MKFSRSLLDLKDIGVKIFENSLHRSKDLLSEVFELDFNNNDSKILEIIEDKNNYKFEIIFSVGKRELKAAIKFKEDKEDIVTEVLVINEVAEESVVIENPSDFKTNVNKIMDYLEQRFDINLTMLDPEEKDDKIKEININKEDLTFDIMFTQEHHEGRFKGHYEYIKDEKYNEQNIFHLTHYREHKIFLD